MTDHFDAIKTRKDDTGWMKYWPILTLLVALMGTWFEQKIDRSVTEAKIDAALVGVNSATAELKQTASILSTEVRDIREKNIRDDAMRERTAEKLEELAKYKTRILAIEKGISALQNEMGSVQRMIARIYTQLEP